jgi:hypothetical protein
MTIWRSSAGQMTRNELVAFFKQERNFYHQECAIAKTLAHKYPAISHQLKTDAEWQIAILDEGLRRLNHRSFSADLMGELARDAVRRQQERERLRSLSLDELERSYFQSLWKDRRLVKAANRDGLSLHELAGLVIDAYNAAGQHAPHEPNN